ncbi:hypothetical protein ACMA5I_11425 [Paracoccaceae bacterium GXU_MW_L88]
MRAAKTTGALALILGLAACAQNAGGAMTSANARDLAMTIFAENGCTMTHPAFRAAMLQRGYTRYAAEVGEDGNVDNSYIIDDAINRMIEDGEIVIADEVNAPGGEASLTVGPCASAG